MGNSQTMNVRTCVCMNSKANDQWIICEKCFNWFHPQCASLSIEDYNRFLNNTEIWFCEQCTMSNPISSINLSLNDEPAEPAKSTDQSHGKRAHLSRKCKQKNCISQPAHDSENIVIENTSDNVHLMNNDLSEFLLLADEDLRKINQAKSKHKSKDIRTSERVVCNCGFIAKNNLGLRIHWGKQKKSVQLDNVQSIQKESSPNNDVDLKLFVNEFGVLLSKCKRLIPVSRIIQKSVRIIVCQELTNVIKDVISNNNLASWMRLLAFPYLVLNTTKKLNNTGKNYVRLNLADFKKVVDVNVALNKLLLDYGCVQCKKSIITEDLIVKTANRKVGEGDIRGAIRVLSSNESIAEPSFDTKSKLRSKHPDDNEVEDIFSLEHDLIATKVDDVCKAIRDFPLSSSGGVDGLRPRHLKDLISFSCGDSASHLINAIVSLTDLVKAGKIVKDIQPIFYGASLIAFDKKKIDVRPIAVGIVWRRLAGKIACFHIKNDLSEILCPIQLGFGVRGGAEALIHAVRCFAKADHAKPMAIIKFDFKNAFNMMFRKYLLTEVKEISPEIFPMIQQAYSSFSNLFYDEDIILSKRGVQQGDPLGPPGFCIGIMKMTHSLFSRLNGWYLDDGTIGDELSVLLTDIKKVLQFCEVSGMSLNPDKCEVFFVNASAEEETEMYSEISNLLPGIRIVDESSFELLGAPIFDLGLHRMLSAKIENVDLLASRLNLLDVHSALCIFKSSLSTPRFNYLLRTCKSFMVPNLLDNVDEMFRSTLEIITNTKLNVISWRQASLPLSFGGLGIRRATDLAYPAYLSSIHKSADLSNRILEKFGLSILDDEISMIMQGLPPDLVPLDVESRKIQKKWDLLGVEIIFNDLLSSSEPVDRARLLASSTKESSKWLQVVPSSQLGLLLDNNTARIAVALRLGSQICEEHICVCGKLVEKNGRHGLSCNMSKGWTPRHNDFNNVCSSSITSAGIPNILQPKGISRTDGKRPDGMTLIPWSRGKSLLWDVTVRDTLAPSYIHLSSVNAGAVADLAERKKHNHYIKLKENHLFTPIAFESLGCCGPETKEFLSDLGKRLRTATGEPRSLDYLYQKISIAIQRGNAACIFGTFGKRRCDDFYLL